MAAKYAAKFKLMRHYAATNGGNQINAIPPLFYTRGGSIAEYILK